MTDNAHVQQVLNAADHSNRLDHLLAELQRVNATLPAPLTERERLLFGSAPLVVLLGHDVSQVRGRGADLLREALRALEAQLQEASDPFGHPELIDVVLATQLELLRQFTQVCQDMAARTRPKRAEHAHNWTEEARAKL